VPDAVAEEFIVGTKAGVADYLSGGGIYFLAGNAGPCGPKGSRLGTMDNIEHALHSVAGFAHYEGARNVRLIAFHRATVIDNHRRAFGDHLRRNTAVRSAL